MQNKPNYKDAQMNVNIYYTEIYEKISDWTIGQNKPNSNPIKPNFQKAQNRLPENLATHEPGTLDLTKDKCYRVIVNMTHSSIRKGVKTNASAIKSS
jgi:hypothetical protein